MRLLVPACLLFLRLTAAAQTPENPYLDSLWQVYRAPGLDAHERLIALHDIVDETRYVNTDSARTLADDLMRQATTQGDTIAMALAHRDLGAIADADRDNAAAIAHYRAALSLYASGSDSVHIRGMAATLHNMGIIFKNQGDPDTALVLYRQSIELERSIGYEEGMMYGFGSIGRVFEIQGMNDSALAYYERSGAIAEKLGEKRMMAASYGNRANVHERMGQIGPAIDLAYKCLAIMEELGNERGIATALTTVASLKHELGEERESLDLLRRSHALYTKVGYRQGMMTSGRSIGADLLELEEADSAIGWLEKAVALEREFNAKDLLAPTLNSLAKAYWKTDRNAQAEGALNEALAIGREMKDAPTEAATLALLGRVAIDRGGALGVAIDRCKQGLRVAEAAAALSERGDNCECLYLAYKAKGDGLTALRYLEEFHAVKDSIATEKNTRELTQRDMLHTFGKEQLADSLRHASELTDLDHARTVEQLRADRNRKTALGFGAAGALLVAGVSAFFISDRRRRRARFEKDAAQLETQALRSQMNPHFIFNALNSINAFVQKNEPDRASSYLSKFARLMRLVLENSRQSEVPLKDDLEALDAYLHLERTRSGDKFDYTITVDPTLDQEEVLVPPLVIQPFVENAIWHGMAGKEGKGHIALKVTRRGDELVMAIEDDGVGRNAPKAEPRAGDPPMKKTSLATTITQARLDLVRKQKGRPAGFGIIDLPQGTRVEVTLPIDDGT